MFKTAVDLRLMQEILTLLKIGEKPKVSDSDVRRLANDLMALTILKDVPTEDEIEELRERGMFIEADDLCKIEPGDSLDVDAINASLGAAGFDAGYCNNISLNSITVSTFYLDGEELGVVSRQMDYMVESWDGKMIKVFYTMTASDGKLKHDEEWIWDTLTVDGIEVHNSLEDIISDAEFYAKQFVATDPVKYKNMVISVWDRNSKLVKEIAVKGYIGERK